MPQNLRRVRTAKAHRYPVQKTLINAESCGEFELESGQKRSMPEIKPILVQEKEKEATNVRRSVVIKQPETKCYTERGKSKKSRVKQREEVA